LRSILLAINGIGLGHASRCLRLASRIDAGYAIYIATYGDAYRYLSSIGLGRRYVLVRDAEISFCWGEAGLAVGRTIASLLLRHSMTFAGHVASSAALLKAIRPEVVISDSRLAPLVAARLFADDTPTVLITNQLVSYVEGAPLQDRINRALSGLSPRAWGLSDEIIVADLPPPYTISLRNIYPAMRVVGGKSRFIGLLDDLGRYGEASPGGEGLYIAISGPRPDRGIFFKMVIPCLKDLGRMWPVKVSLGDPSMGETLLYRRRAGRGYIEIYGWVRDRLLETRKARVLVLRGGQTSILEAIMMLKPMVVVPAEGQTEQEGNAESVARLGIGEYVRSCELAREPRLLVEAVARIFEDYDRYVRRLAAVRRVLVGCGGLRAAEEIIKKYLS